MKNVTIYTTAICGYCVAAKSLLDQEGIPYHTIDVTSDSEKRRWLIETTGMRTVPQIFFDDVPIGGFDQLKALKQSGQLHHQLEDQISS